MNLDKGFNKKEVKAIFSAYGNVMSCAVELDSTGISKGCGYVQFNREEDALNATVKLNGVVLNGLILYVGPLCSKQEKELNLHIDENLKFTNVFIGNLSDWITERDLILTFGEFGLINNVEVLRDEGVSKCCGLVNFENWEDAARSVEVLNRRKIHGKIWRVRRADRQYEEGHFISGPKAMTHLCVHHIDHTIEDAEFKKLFSRFGTITACKFMRDRQGRSQGYGSVVFSTTDEAIEAVSLMNDRSIGCRIGEGTKNRNRGLQASVFGTLFFKNLDKEIDEKGLKDKFSAYGNVISCSVILDSSGISQGFGYVQFDNEEDARNATKQLNSVDINGKKLYVNTDITKLNFSVVYVSNFSELMIEEDLQSTFGEYGLVDHVYLARDEDGISKCFGHVCFEKWEDAAKSVEGLNDKIFHGKNWHVERAHSGCENDQFNMRNLFVKNIDDTVDKKGFKELFSPFGVITSCEIKRRHSRRRNRYGFVEFSSVEEAIEAIKGLNGKWIGSKHLYVGIAERKYINQSLQSQDSTMHQTTRVPPMIATHAPPAGVGQQNFYVPSPMPVYGLQPQPVPVVWSSGTMYPPPGFPWGPQLQQFPPVQPNQRPAPWMDHQQNLGDH